MPENVNTSALDIKSDVNEGSEDARPTMIKVDHVSMTFNKASEQLNNLKEYAIKIAKHELFFEGFKALNDVSFEVKKGDVFGIMGTNGSGKSTMLKIIAGVLEPTSGTCQINGSIAPLIELGAGFDMDLTARENIYLNGALLGYSKDFIDQHYDDIIDFAEIESFLDMPMKNYSSGMVARIAFAIATVIVPEILIVDEVLSVGDFMFQKKCEDRINELIDKHGVTVLIVSHSNDQIARLCNKAIWIEKGHTRLMGDAAMVTRVYGGLGGRTGSPEAEKRVFEALMRVGEVEVPKSAYKTITGETPASVNAKLVTKTWKETNFDTVALACDVSHANAIVANALAAAYSAPVLTIGAKSVPESTELLLRDYEPKIILIFDFGGAASEAIARINELPWSPEVVRFEKKARVTDFSIEVFEYGRERGYWSDTVAVVDYDDNLESFCAMPYAYAKQCPVIVVRGHDDWGCELNAFLKGNRIKKVLCFGHSLLRRCSQDKVNQEYGIACVGGFTEKESCLLISEFVFDQLCGEASDPIAIHLFKMSMSEWPSMVSSGCCVNTEPAVLLLVDESDLDFVDKVLLFFKKHRNQFMAPFYLVGKGLLSEDKVELFIVESGNVGKF